MPARETSHTVRNVKVRLFTAGEGPPLVFLHGAGGVERWLPFFDLLAARHNVMVPEHPGFGASDNPPWMRNVADVAMYYLDFLDTLGDGKVHLVGNSLGGWIAAELATRNCAHLATLALLAPAGIRVKGVLSGDNFIWGPEEGARNLFHDQTYAERFITAAAGMSEAEADRALANRFMATKLGWEPRWFNPALERWLHRIAVPTLVVWGAEDKLLPVQYAEVWRREIPDVRVEILPACGHLLQIEQAAGVADKVLALTGGKGGGKP
jgi:pimeloyl-ACP methyl ester carboxylesterase